MIFTYFCHTVTINHFFKYLIELPTSYLKRNLCWEKIQQPETIYQMIREIRHPDLCSGFQSIIEVFFSGMDLRFPKWNKPRRRALLSIRDEQILIFSGLKYFSCLEKGEIKKSLLLFTLKILFELCIFFLLQNKNSVCIVFFSASFQLHI